MPPFPSDRHTERTVSYELSDKMDGRYRAVLYKSVATTWLRNDPIIVPRTSVWTLALDSSHDAQMSRNPGSQNRRGVSQPFEVFFGSSASLGRVWGGVTGSGTQK